MSNENEQATPMTDAYGQNAFTKQEHLHGRIAELERQLAEAQRDLLTREEGGEWVSRCDHEDALAESVSKSEAFDLIEDIYLDHRNLDSSGYNECDEDPCMWCIRAGKLFPELLIVKESE
jgi:hypothetical protein